MWNKLAVGGQCLFSTDCFQCAMFAARKLLFQEFWWHWCSVVKCACVAAFL